MTRYEITVELPNGDWVWKHCQVGVADTEGCTRGAHSVPSSNVRDYHDMLAWALDYAFSQGGRVHHIEKLGS